MLLDLRHDPQARPAGRHQGGLFHTAFLVPDRAALTDPEGNGIEIYHDRPSEEWTILPDGSVAMATLPLDLDGLAASRSRTAFEGMRDDTILGHVHLQVGELDAAAAFYGGQIGLGLTTRYPGANFFGSEGYHHHIGTNIWNSRGAGPRPEGTTGLVEVELLATPEAAAGFAGRMGPAPAGAMEARDPWGTRLTIRMTMTGSHP